jgi:photosystem II stability/assembly factor-like uncharacterized protein
MRFALLVFFVLDSVNSYSQTVDIITYQEGKIHARGIEYANNSLYLACSNGMLYRYDLDNKKTYILNPVEEAPELRDVAHNKSHVLTMQSGKEGLVIWTDQFGNRTASCYLKDEKGQAIKEVFWDGIAIENKLGFLMGDPIDGYFTLYYSSNAGIDWNPCFGRIKAFDGEAGFAASGSTVQIQDGVFYFVSGGLKSRIHYSRNKGKTWESIEIPFESKESAGPFSLAIKDKLNMLVVGGDYTNATGKEKNCFFTKDGGKSWQASTIPPSGYRSCVIYTDGIYYACGTNGMDYSQDNGKTWQNLNDFNTFSMAFDSQYIYASSVNGKVIKLKKVK